LEAGNIEKEGGGKVWAVNMKESMEGKFEGKYRRKISRKVLRIHMTRRQILTLLGNER